MVENETPTAEFDPELDRAFDAISSMPGFAERSQKVVREAVDQVLQGDETARCSISELTPEEKKHIGTKVEHGLKREFFANRKGEHLDTIVDGVEVDIKNTVGETWMIPPEATNRLCILSAIDERSQRYSIGLLRAAMSLLNKPNQDQKRSLSKKGRDSIRWIVKDGSLRVSIFVSCPDIKRLVFLKTTGQSRVAELFRQVRFRPIQRSDIERAAAHNANRQIDLRARVRDARTKLRSEGLLLLRGWNPQEREQARVLGYRIDTTQCISVTAETAKVISDGHD